MSNVITPVGRNCSTAIPGVKDILFFTNEEVQTMPDQFCDPVVGDVVFKPSMSSYYIQHALRTANFRERQITNNKAGDYFEQVLRFEIYKDRLEVRRNIIRLANNRVHVMYRDEEGSFKLVKNMRHVADFGTGPSKNKYNFTLKSLSRKPAPWFEDFTPVGSTTPGSGPVTIVTIGQSNLQIVRWLYPNVSGSTLTIDSSIPDEPNNVFVYRGTGLIPWDQGVTKAGSTLTFNFDLDEETIEVVHFKFI